jgi:hypothetical protein
MTGITAGFGRGTLAALAAGILLGGCATTGSPTASDAPVPAPVLDAVTFHTQMERYQIVYPEFHFHDDSGTVRYIHRELITTDAPGLRRINTDGIIHIPAELQRKGTVFVGGWGCGPGSYYVTIRAFLINLEGRRSNTLQYTIHCNGG